MRLFLFPSPFWSRLQRARRGRLSASTAQGPWLTSVELGVDDLSHYLPFPVVTLVLEV